MKQKTEQVIIKAVGLAIGVCLFVLIVWSIVEQLL